MRQTYCGGIVQPTPTVRHSCTSCRAFAVHLCNFSSMPTMQAFTAVSRLSPPMGLGAGYKVATRQALHLTRRRWSALPRTFDHVGRCHISRGRLNGHPSVSSSWCFGVSCRPGRFCPPPFGKASIHPAFFRRRPPPAWRSCAFFRALRKCDFFRQSVSLSKYHKTIPEKFVQHSRLTSFESGCFGLLSACTHTRRRVC